MECCSWGRLTTWKSNVKNLVSFSVSESKLWRLFPNMLFEHLNAFTASVPNTSLAAPGVLAHRLKNPLMRKVRDGGRKKKEGGRKENTVNYVTKDPIEGIENVNLIVSLHDVKATSHGICLRQRVVTAPVLWMMILLPKMMK